MKLSSTFLLLSLFLFDVPVYAYHLAGGTMYYKCVGADSFDVTLELYRDCSSVFAANFDEPAYIGIYDMNGILLDTLMPHYEYPITTDTISVCPGNSNIICREKATYIIHVFNFMQTGGIDVVYQRCCRNQALSNIEQSSNIGATYFVHIPDASVASCNSSPLFSHAMTSVLCYGQHYEFDGGATDADGDSLIYSFAASLQGGDQIDPQPNPPAAPPFLDVVYTSPFVSEYPINSIPPIEIDANTGAINVTPSSLGIFLIGEEVSEYRNGVFIGKTFRDFEWTVSETVGINNIGSKDLPFQIDPNPASDYMDITYESNEDALLELYDVFGKRVAAVSLFHYFKNRLLDVSNLPAGTYLATVNENGRNVWSEKVVVAR